MSYLSVISLDTAKDHLRIERDETASDPEIKRMIRAACIFVERYTNHYLVPQTKTYHLGSDGFLNIYDYPIFDMQTGAATSIPKSNYSRFCGGSNQSISLDIGYRLGKDIPSDMIEEILEIIAVWFYGSDKDVNTTVIPMNVKQVLDLYRRFTL